jgi:hypothetical protein
MTKEDEIIEMAKQAGCFEKHQVFYFTQQDLEAFAKLVAEREREACAKLFEQGDEMGEWYSYEVSKEIRARGQA